MSLWWWAACRSTEAPVVLDPPDVSVCPGEGVSASCIPSPEDQAIRHGWASVAVDEQGRAHVLFAIVQNNAVTGLSLARSIASGAPFEPAISLPIPVSPNVGTTEKPSLAVHGQEVAVAFTGSSPMRHGDARALWLLRGRWQGDETIAWAEPLVLDQLLGEDLVLEHARVAFSPDGELWALWKRQRYAELDLAFWARESEGFAPERVSEALSTDHDCSPPDFRFGPSGRALLALRSNVDGWLDTFVVHCDPAAGSADLPVQVSSDEWRYHADICPEDGPRIAELMDGTLYVTWLAPNAFSWALHSAWSSDGGERWTAPSLAFEGSELGERWVSLVADAQGLHLAVEGLDGQTRLLQRSRPEAPYSERWLEGGDGGPLEQVELATGGGRTVALGLDRERRLWLLELSHE